jgi:ribosomal protein S18 acetylase RimI-like enzyme
VDTPSYRSSFSHITTAADNVQPSGQFYSGMTSKTVKVRPLQLADVAKAADVITDSFKIGAAFGGWLQPLFKIGIHEDLRNRLNVQAPDQAVCLVATVGVEPTDVVGTIEISARSPLYNPSMAKRYVYISNLAVDNDYRRLGIGRELVRQCESIAQQWGFKDIYLHVMADNLPGQHLYLRLGFEILSRDQTWHFWPWQRADRLFLRKRL